MPIMYYLKVIWFTLKWLSIYNCPGNGVLIEYVQQFYATRDKFNISLMSTTTMRIFFTSYSIISHYVLRYMWSWSYQIDVSGKRCTNKIHSMQNHFLFTIYYYKRRNIWLLLHKLLVKIGKFKPWMQNIKKKKTREIK